MFTEHIFNVDCNCLKASWAIFQIGITRFGISIYYSKIKYMSSGLSLLCTRLPSKEMFLNICIVPLFPS